MNIFHFLFILEAPDYPKDLQSPDEVGPSSGNDTHDIINAPNDAEVTQDNTKSVHIVVNVSTYKNRSHTKENKLKLN